MRCALACAALLTASSAAAEPLVFVRIDQTGGMRAGEFGTSWSLEAARAVVALEGSSERGTYVGATHRLAAAYGITDWLSVGFDQSIKQETADDLRLGMFSPILRFRLDRLGLPVEGLGVYTQLRIHVTGRRPDSFVSGALYERDLGAAHVSGLVGFERSLSGDIETGLRTEMGASFRAGEAWRIAGELWGHSTWRPDGLREDGYHAGPSVQYRWTNATVGAQLGLGIESRTGQTIFDGVLLARLGFKF